MTDNPWARLARDLGPQAVMNPTISVETLDAETARQEKAIFPLIAKHLTGKEHAALDFGCGAGRLTRPLNRILLGASPITVGFDPCQELLTFAPVTLGVSWESGPSSLFFFRHPRAFDVVLVAMVLGQPGLDLDATAEGLARVLASDGTIFLIDHMTDTQPPDKWWRFWPASVYRRVFARYGIEMRKIGDDRQLDNPVTILAGRRA